MGNSKVIFSIHLVSNNPEAVKEAILNIEETANNPSEIELVIMIDEGDLACINAITSLQSSSKLNLRYFETNKIKCFDDLWKPDDDSLATVSKEVYFVTIFNDEFRFKTKGWDDILKKYIGYYEDDIFRIRLSRYRFRNYKDFWECIYAPDSVAFYTKKWLDITKTKFHTDTWQQLVAFYLVNSRKFDHIQYSRDIVEPFIEIEGEGAGVGLSLLKAREKNKSNVIAWFKVVSYSMQEKAKYAAAKLKEAILMHDYSQSRNEIDKTLFSNQKPPAFKNKDLSKITSHDDKTNKNIEFFYKGKSIYKISYKINKWKIFLINNLRKLSYSYYSGGGSEVLKPGIINRLYTYYRISKYGNFGYKEFVTKPLPTKTNKLLRKAWPIIMPIAATLKILWISLLKITFSEKYFRFLRRKISKIKSK